MCPHLFGYIEIGVPKKWSQRVGITESRGGGTDPRIDLLYGFGRRQFRQLGVSLRHGSDSMSTTKKTPDNFARVIDHVPDYKEGCVDTLRSQRVDDLVRGRRQRTIIERQHQFMLLKWQGLRKLHRPHSRQRRGIYLDRPTCSNCIWIAIAICTRGLRLILQSRNRNFPDFVRDFWGQPRLDGTSLRRHNMDDLIASLFQFLQ